MSTNSAAPGPPGDAHLDEWLGKSLPRLTESLDDVLNIEAGLRDAQLPNRTRSIDATLDTVLDLAAGLRAILPHIPQPQQEQEGSSADDAPPLNAEPLEELAKNLASRPLRERLGLRSWVPLNELHLIYILAKARVEVSDLDRALIGGFDTSDLSRVDSDLAYTRALASDLTLDLTLDRALASARAVARELAHARRPALTLKSARDLASDLALDLDLALTCALDLTCAHARDLARTGESALASASAIALARARDRLRERAVSAAKGLVAGIAALDAAVTDFTTADLTDLDLRGIDLRGVRWSSLTTRWSPEWEDPIREASVQIDPDQHPDLYEVRDDPRVRHTVT